MKNLVLVFCGLFVFIAIQTYAQDMLKIGKQWIFEDMHYSTIWFPYSDTTIETITITKDTFINNNMYVQVVASRLPGCWNVSNPEYLREEGEKIYRLSHDLQSEYLMIDFEESTSYEMLYDNGVGVVDTGTALVDSFGTETVFDGTILNVQYVRILNNQSYDDNQLYKVYENIGFLYPGILFPDLGTGLCDFQDGITLRCVTDGMDTIHFTENDCFELPIINHTGNISNSDLIIFPNPVYDVITIPDGFTFLNMTTFAGMKIVPAQQGNKIFMSVFPSGIYCLRFLRENTNEYFIHKIIKL